MTFLPVVERELRVAARRRGAYWARLAAAGGAVLCSAAILLWRPIGGVLAAQTGDVLLSVLTSLVFSLCLLSGPVLTADALSEERREGTLGLLFLTDLRGLDVVLGKLAAASVTALFGLLAVLPMLAIPILLGGVDLGEFVRLALVLVNTLFLSLAIGLAMSACCVQGRSALALTVFGLFLLAGLVPLFVDLRMSVGWASLAASTISPTCVLWLASAATYQQQASAFWLSIGVTHALAWLLLVLAGALTARVWREPTGWFARVSHQRRWHNWCYGHPNQRRNRRWLLDKNPVAWLGQRQQLKQRLLWVSIGVALAFWVWFRIRHAQFADSGSTVFLIGLLLLAPLKWLAASEASQRMAAEMQSGALEVLLTTPMTVREILRGHLQSMGHMFLWPAAAVLAVQAVMLSLIPSATHADRALVGMAIVGMVMCIWDLHALAWVGMWLGATLRKPSRAFAGTVLRILVAPWGLLALTSVVIGWPYWYSLWPLWLVICVALNLFYSLQARTRLHNNFRRHAAERYAAG